MPATNLGWLLDQNTPVFQVYGTKRNSSCLGPPALEMEEVHLAAKRKCARSEPMLENEMNQYMDFTSDHHLSVQNSLSECNLLCQKQQPVDLTQCPLATPILDDTMNTLPSVSVPEQEQQALIGNNNGDTNNNTNGHLMSHFQHAVEQNDMVMDHEIHTFIPVQVGDVRQNDEACSSMESEGATDPSQYSTAYCDNFCVGGDYSPTSGRVRCLCRPSWEGLLDVRPYVSDYY
ncbi:hypothetical protein CHS0354_005059 [Potamilus streckersoni]|uniref:Uncharacterized protein n=1 Tax=Potamilus streckersoni TaxID=2493646 RepID=A0AAE0SHL1_9BIVA|nr:hypothetical protein CHS0354_005059 [Potamilus streckersoni]